MPLSHVPIEELRSLCKTRIEILELWLRRLIHDKLSNTFGINYFSCQVAGNYLLRADVRKYAERRVRENPSHYSKPLDALLLDHLVYILCKEELFHKCFRAALAKAFPDGSTEARTFLKRLVAIRNPLAHANPISNHQALRVLCHTEDIIESIQEHYAAMNAKDPFNAPNFVTFRDSAGNSVQIGGTQEHIDLRRTTFRVGDSVRFEVDTDDIHGNSTVQWVVNNIPNGESATGASFVLNLLPRHVNTDFSITGSVVSSRDWHRHGNFDALVSVTYTVLPLP